MAKSPAKKSDIAAAILKQLKDPFKENLVKYATVGGGKVISYVDARDVMKRLDDVMGPENWKDNYTRTDGGYVCELSLRIEGEWITKSGVSNDTKIAPQKGGESGAFKRAAVKFGVGRYFYYFNPLQWTKDNTDEWPAIFKPGAPEDWEDIAELEYGLLESTEGEFGEEVVNNLDAIRGAKSSKELLEIFNALDTGQQSALGKEFQTRSAELIAEETAKALEKVAKTPKKSKKEK